ncbi:glycosyltransferase, partial [Streptomyces sp. NRRL S-15]|uniref:glycosyltransferase n=1 Tax=Streptomyces sp. NRRL S-15 TaxID=1463886 RepID=UPI0004C4B153
MLLSVVVPAHRVQGYLRAALESVTQQPEPEGGPAGLELVAVGASRDAPELAIARECAGRDSRVRLLTLDGPWDTGAARNAGAATARGTYLLFLDGDDLLLPGALAEITARLSEDRPDVLRLGHDQVDWWGTAQPDDELPAARNQLYRRAFWDAHRLRFTEGPYDDVVPVHRAALLASDAGTLASLDRICVRHRLRRTGTSATTPGRAHFAVIDAYERLTAETG